MDKIQKRYIWESLHKENRPIRDKVTNVATHITVKYMHGKHNTNNTSIYIKCSITKEGKTTQSSTVGNSYYMSIRSPGHTHTKKSIMETIEKSLDS